jgi:hypothetical protein
MVHPHTEFSGNDTPGLQPVDGESRPAVSADIFYFPGIPAGSETEPGYQPGSLNDQNSDYANILERQQYFDDVTMQRKAEWSKRMKDGLVGPGDELIGGTFRFKDRSIEEAIHSRWPTDLHPWHIRTVGDLEQILAEDAASLKLNPLQMGVVTSLLQERQRQI